MTTFTTHAASVWKDELLIFSAESQSALSKQLARWHVLPSALTLSELAAHLAQQPAAPYRLAVIAHDRDDLVQKCDRALAYLDDPGRTRFNLGNRIFYGRAQDYAHLRQTALLFPGFGAQHPTMVADLYKHFGIIRRWFEKLDPESRRRFQKNNLLFHQQGSDIDQRKAATSMAEPGFANSMDAVLAGNLSLHTLTELLGLSAEAMVGHSYGENAMMIASGMVDDYRFVVDLVRY
ncbi:MAG: hypothetical protein R3293_00920, partial [Candidatus Promineifilaceae bacterium]|nr:hypothetical protein [Candidatus Promineifilaceae bacterium]